MATLQYPLYIGVDFFDPSLFDNTWQAGRYIILQPLVRVEDLQAYFDLASVPALASTYGLPTSTNAPPQYVPVPFRPDDVTFEGASPAPWVKESIGDAAWLELVRRNDLHVRIATFAALDAMQRTTVVAWADVLRKWVRERTRTSKNCDQKSIALNQIYFADTPSPDEWTKRVATLYEKERFPPLLQCDDSKFDPLPPRIVHSRKQLDEGRLAIADLFDGASTHTYQDYVWTKLKAASTHSLEDVQHTLGRLFGFGEHIHWPKPASSDRMMIGPEKDGWVVTNPHSLLGLVFRFEPRPEQGDTPVFRVQMTGVATPFGEITYPRVNESLGYMAKDAALWPKPQTVTFAPRAQPLSSKPDPVPADLSPSTHVYYAHKRAPYAELGTTDKKSVRAIPSSILDMLVPESRIEMPLAQTDGKGTAGVAAAKLLDVREEARTAMPSDLSSPPKVETYVRWRAQLSPAPLSGAPAHETFLLVAPDLADTPIDLGQATILVRAQALKMVEIAATNVDRQGGRLRFVDPALDAKLRAAGADASKVLQVDLLMPSTDRFNTVLFDIPVQDAPEVVLANHFTSKVGRSADLLAQDIRLELDGISSEHLKDHKHPLASHLVSHNKVQIGLKGSSGDSFDLTEGHSILPASEEADASYALHFPLTHTFVQAPTDARSEVADEDIANNEDFRFRLFACSTQTWTMELKATHQYGTTIEARALGDLTQLTLPISTDIRNPAALLLAPPRPADDKPKPPARDDLEPPPPFHALTYTSDPYGVISVAFDRAYFARALAMYAAQARPEIAVMRTIYECFLDLVASKGTAVFAREAWRFSNDAPSFAPGEADPCDPRPPMLTPYMRHVDSAWAPLSDSLAAAIRTVVEPGVADPQPFRRFVDALRTCVDDENHSLWSPAALGLAQVPSATNVVRLALRVERDPARVIASASYAAERCWSIDPPTETSTVSTTEREVAFNELKDYADPQPRSRLFRSDAWVTAKRPSEAARQLDAAFGDVSPFLTQTVEAEQAKGSFFYVPYAFRPLAAHQEIGDSALVEDFVEYLLLVLDDVLHGRTLTRLGIVAPTSEEALGAARAARDLARACASKLAALVYPVENVSQDKERISDPTFANAWNDQAAEAFKKDLIARLGDSPGLYATARGFAMVLERERLDQLHTIQLAKDLSPDHPSTEAVDRSRFAFTSLVQSANEPGQKTSNRFWVDVLSSAMYGDELVIANCAGRDADEVIRDQAHFEDTAAPRHLKVEISAHNARWMRTGIEHYPLPSRRPPTVPKPLNGPATRRRPRAFATAPSRPSSFLLLRFGTTSHPDDVLADLAPRDPNAIAESFASAVSTPEDVKKLRPAVRLDAFAMDYEFVFEQESLDESLDAFEIDVSVNDRLDPSIAPPQQEMSTTGTPAANATNVWNWFVYQRAQRESAAASAPPPAVMLGTLMKELGDWLETGTLLKGMEATPLPRRPSRPTANYVKENGRWTITGNVVSRPDAAGAILAVQRLERQTPPVPVAGSGEAATQETKSPKEQTLRITVLGTVWTDIAVRVRIRRNAAIATDFGKTSHEIIDPMFQLLSPYSATLSHAHEVVRLGADDMAGLPLGQGVLLTSRTFDEPKELGPILSNALRAEWGDIDAGVTEFPLWSTPLLAHSRANVVGLIVQSFKYAPPAAGAADDSTSRTSTVVRQHLEEISPNGDLLELDKLFSSAVDFATRAPLARIIWMTPDRAPVLDVTWPLFFTEQHQPNA